MISLIEGKERLAKTIEEDFISNIGNKIKEEHLNNFEEEKKRTIKDNKRIFMSNIFKFLFFGVGPFLMTIIIFYLVNKNNNINLTIEMIQSQFVLGFIISCGMAGLALRIVEFEEFKKTKSLYDKTYRIKNRFYKEYIFKQEEIDFHYNYLSKVFGKDWLSKTIQKNKDKNEQLGSYFLVKKLYEEALKKEEEEHNSARVINRQLDSIVRA